MRKIVLYVIAAIVIAGSVIFAVYNANQQSAVLIPSLYYTSNKYAEEPAKAVLGSHTWGWMSNTGEPQAVASDYPHAIDQMNDEQAGLTVSNSSPVLLSIGYAEADNVENSLPKVLNVEVQLLNGYDQYTAIETRVLGDELAFDAPESEGEYVYNVLIEYEQGNVNYSMKIWVVDDYYPMTRAGGGVFSMFSTQCFQVQEHMNGLFERTDMSLSNYTQSIKGDELTATFSYRSENNVDLPVKLMAKVFPDGRIVESTIEIMESMDDNLPNWE